MDELEFFGYADGVAARCEGNNLMPSDEDIAIFGPYVRNDYLNTSKVLNGTNFFTFAPVAMSTYYWTIVKRNLEWFYGYVWGIHNIGVLSTKTGSKICKMSASLTLSGGLRFEGTPRAEQFTSNFFKTRKIEGKLKQKLPIHNAIGFTLAKIDINGKGELDINFVQGNRYFAQTDDEKKVLAFYAVLKVISAQPSEDNTNNDDGFYLVEERYYKGNSPVQRYRMYKGPVIASSPTYEVSKTKGVEFEFLPTEVQKYIVKRFGRNILNKEFILPFGSIGAQVMLNSYSATGMDEYACFSDSTIADIHTQLYELDLTKTQKGESKYICQDFVAMPTEMIGTAYTGDPARAFAADAQSVGFNKRIVKKARYVDPTKATPFVYSPDFKALMYNEDINQIMNEIAAGAQFSPITIAGYLRNGTEKTATEVTADENATRLTVEDKRSLIADALNPLIEIVLNHYGILDQNGCPEECTLLFNDGSLTNPKAMLENLAVKQQNGWISSETAIGLANPQFTKREAKEEQDKIIGEKAEEDKRQKEFNFTL